MKHHHRPAEPPIPEPHGYPQSNAAARRTAARPHLPTLIAALCALGIVLVVAGTVGYAERNPAQRAADRTAVASTSRPIEYAPAVPVVVPGDGMWLVGKQIKPGIYRSTAGPRCYWERLAGLSGKWADLIDNGGFRNGPTLVEVRSSDFAFSSQGCVKWVMVP